MKLKITPVPFDLIKQIADKFTPPKNDHHRPASAPSTAIPVSIAFPEGEELTRRIRAYLARIPPAISGKGGHNQTFYVANRLVRGFDLRPEEALPFLLEYNDRCQPPWTEADLRRKLSEADKQPGPRGTHRHKLASPVAFQPATSGGDTSARPTEFRNYVTEEVSDGETKRLKKRPRSIADMFEELQDTAAGYPQRASGVLYAPDPDGNGVYWIDSANSFYAWISRQYAPPVGAKIGGGVDWFGGQNCVTKGEFYAYAESNAESFDAVETHPHYPTLPRVAYFHPQPKPGDGSALRELLKQFSPASSEDHDLIFAFLLTLFWGGPGGQRPLFVFEAGNASDPTAIIALNQPKNKGRGAGKSTVANLAGKLCGNPISISMHEQTGDIQRRILGKEGRAKRIALIDNIKSLKYSNPDIEGMITASVISGRQMYVGEGQRPNHLVWVFTFNQPAMSADLASRTILIRVLSPRYSPDWIINVEKMIEERRWEIIGDIMRILQQESALPAEFPYTRWAAWEKAILSHCPNPLRLQAVITRRRRTLDDDEEFAEEVNDAIRELVRSRLAVDPEKIRCLIPIETIYESIAKRYIPQCTSTIYASRWLATIAPQQVFKHTDRHPYRGFVWVGKNSPLGARMVLWS